MASLRRLGASLDDVAAATDRVDLGTGALLLPGISQAHREFADDLAKAEPAIENARAALVGLATAFEGPRDILLLAANNAEMRAE